MPKNPLQLQQERGVRICEKQPCRHQVSEAGGRECAPGVEAKIPLQSSPKGTEIICDEPQPQQEIPYFGSPSFKNVNILSAIHKSEA